MSIDEVITSLILLPRRQNDLGASAYTLLKGSSYFKYYEEVSVDLIREALMRNPECVQEWAQFSEDKRSTGWYLARQSDGTFEIGYIPAKGKSKETPPRRYLDETSACAAFIKLEIEDIREG